MAKQGTHNYENLLEADLWEVFGDDIMNKVLEFHKDMNEAYQKEFNSSLKDIIKEKKNKIIIAIILHNILVRIYKVKNEKLKKALLEQGIAQLLVVN